MIKIELTEAQLDDLKTVLDYICSSEEQSYHEYADDYGSEMAEDHVFNLANNLRSLTWSKV
jgi:sensor c-di-GMP phosphodiesterase-like protein